MPPAAVSFAVSAADARLISEIAARAAAIADATASPLNERALVMDLTACRANGTPLRLAALLEAADPDFVHDIWGIQRHIDRTTGQLPPVFGPRHAAPASGSVKAEA